MISRKQFRLKLNKIYDVLCKHTDEVVSWDEAHLIPDMRLRYAIILAAVDDLYYGTDAEKLNAHQYLESARFINESNILPIPEKWLNKIIYHPEQYAPEIQEYDPQVAENDLLI